MSQFLIFAYLILSMTDLMAEALYFNVQILEQAKRKYHKILVKEELLNLRNGNKKMNF